MLTILKLEKIDTLTEETLAIIDRLMDTSKDASKDEEERLAEIHLLMEWMNIGKQYFNELREKKYQEIQHLIDIEAEEGLPL